MKCDEKENDVDSGDGDAVDHNDEESEDTLTHTFLTGAKINESGRSLLYSKT